MILVRTNSTDFLKNGTNKIHVVTFQNIEMIPSIHNFFNGVGNFNSGGGGDSQINSLFLQNVFFCWKTNSFTASDLVNQIIFTKKRKS